MPDDPISPKYLFEMNYLAEKLGDILHPNAFCLFVFPHNEARANYISNANRPDIIKVLKEFIERNKANH